MAGTMKGGRRAAKKNLQKHGGDFYARIGRLGGRKSSRGGFAAGEEGRKRASYYGAIGGSISRRRKASKRASEHSEQSGDSV